MNKHKLWSNRDYVLKQVRMNGSKLRYADEIFKNDEEIVYEAIRFSGLNAKHASEYWRNDIKYMTKAMGKDKLAFMYIGEQLQQNPEFLSAVCKKYQNVRIAMHAIKCIEKYELIIPIDGALSLVAVANQNREKLVETKELFNHIKNKKNIAILKANVEKNKNIKKNLCYNIFDAEEDCMQTRGVITKLSNYSIWLDKAYDILNNSLKNAASPLTNLNLGKNNEIKTNENEALTQTSVEEV